MPLDGSLAHEQLSGEMAKVRVGARISSSSDPTSFGRKPSESAPSDVGP
jgi:hypothetical protein